MPDFNPFSGGLATEVAPLDSAPKPGEFDPFATGRATIAAEPVATNPSDRWKTLYGGLDGIDKRVDGEQRAAFASMDKVVKDPKDARARAVNQSFVSTNYGLHGPWVEQNWDAVKLALAEKEFGVKDAAVDERWLYGKIAERMGAAGKDEQNFQDELKPWTWRDELSADVRVASGAVGKFWESIWRPLQELPAPPADLPDVWLMDQGSIPTNPAVSAGLYSGVIKPLLESVESPAGIATFGIGSGLKLGVEAGVPAAKLALGGMSGFFAALMGYATVKATPDAIRTAMNPNATTQEKVEALSGVAGSAAMTLLAGMGAAMELLPDKGAKLGKDLEGKTTAESAERLRQEAVVAKTPEAADALNKAAAQLNEFSFAPGQPESDFRRVGGEKIAAAAVRLPDGTVVEGASHDAIRGEITAPAEPIVDAAESLGLEAKVETGGEEGFVTTTGRFVSREEARDIAEHQGQMKRTEPLKNPIYRADSGQPGEFKHWTTDRDAAELYKYNPGFGGPYLFEAEMPKGNLFQVEVSGWRRLAEDAGVRLPEDRPYDLIYDESVQKLLKDRGYSGVTYLDDFPEGSKTVFLFDDPNAREIETSGREDWVSLAKSLESYPRQARQAVAEILGEEISKREKADNRGSLENIKILKNDFSDAELAEMLRAGPDGAWRIWQRDVLGNEDVKPTEPSFPDARPAEPTGDATPPKAKGEPLQADQVEMEPVPEFPRSSFGQTSLKNAYGELEREAYGFDAAPPSEKRSMTEAWARASEIAERNPEAGRTLAEKLANDPNVGLTDDQSALLLRHKVGLQNALNEAADLASDNTQSPELRAEAQRQVNELSDQLLTLLDAVNKRGSEWGREGRWRQALAREDYSFAAQETLLRAAKSGEELTEAERDGLRERVKALEAAQARYEAKIAAMEALTREQAADRTVRELQRPPAAPRRFKAAEKIRDKLRIESAEAKKRLIAKLNQVNDITQALVDAPEVLRDSAIIGAEKIYSLGLDFAEWSAAMAEEFGPKIKPALGQIWDESKKLFYSENKAAIVDELKKSSGEERQKQLGSFAVELARAKVEAGVKGRDEVVDAVWSDLKEAIPDLTRREAMAAISGYGKFKPLSRDEITTQLRDLKGQMQQVAKLEDMAAGEAPKKTGVERRTPSDEERRLQKQVEAKKKEGGYEVTDPERQLRTAMQAVRRSLENRIKDLARELETGEKEPKPAKTPPTDPKIEALRAVADRIRETLEDVEGKPELTPEERIERAVKSTTEAIDRLEKQLNDGKVFPDRTKTDEPWSPAISKLKNELEDLRAFRKEMQKLERPPKSPEQRALDAVKGNLKRQISDLEKQIDKGENTPKAKRTTALDAEAEALKARRDELRAEFERVFGREGLSDEQRLNIWKAGAVKRISELKERIADKDFEPKPRKPLPMDDEAAKLKGEVERLRQDFWIARAEAEQAKQPAWFKALRTTSNLARASALSGYHTLGKLAMFSLARFSEAPLYEAVSAAIKNLPGVKPIAAKANLEAGAEMAGLAKFYVKAATRGMRDALESLTPANKGKSSLKAELGDRRINAEPVRWYDYFGILHMAEKSPLLRGDFEMRLEKVTQWSIANGLDVNDPLVAGALRKDAFDYSHRAILMENNAFATAITTFTRQLEAANPKTGKIDVTKAGLAWFLRTFVTKGIVRTPANYVVQTMARTPLGLAKGTAQLVVAHMRGIDKLTPEEANSIMRLLKAGAVGSAVFVWGAIDASKDPKDRVFGGYYQPGEKRSVDDVGFGRLRVGSVEMPHILTHNPLTEAGQMGSTFYRVMVARVKHKGAISAEEKGALAGAVAAFVALASEAPIVSPITREVQEIERGEAHKIVADQVAGLIPMFVQNMAADIDGNQSRRAENFEQSVEKNLPGLRDKVPLTKAQKERNVRERLKR